MKTNNNSIKSIGLLTQLLEKSPGYCVLTGAGCSTESGLPAYRDVNGDWQHDKPMEHLDFINSEYKRKFYWARSLQGWPVFEKARPGQTHIMLTRLQESGYVTPIITQNVDRLHQAAGSQAVIDLHGRLDRVICLDCNKTFSRGEFQQRLTSINFDITPSSQPLVRPDGDIQTEPDSLDAFCIPACESCNGVLKPDVVFFGGVLDQCVAAQAVTAVDTSPGLLVIGSSLMVYSGFKLVKRAVEQGKPVVIINQGVTRADDLYTLKIECESGRVLNDISIKLSVSR